MTDLSNYIDNYFQNTLDENEKKAFEQKCITDEQFAEEVAYYITARQIVREKLLEQKQQLWKEPETAVVAEVPAKTPVRSLFVKKILPYAVAACLILAIALSYLNYNNSPQQLAKNYVKKECTKISMPMSGEKDSLTIASEAYNHQDYEQALKYFTALHNSHPADDRYLKYSGFVYLMTKDYDNALQQFNELAGIQDLNKNPGRFLSAVTLILRNEEGDKATAKNLLQEVIDKKLVGQEDAGKIMESL